MFAAAMQGALRSLGNDDRLARPKYELMPVDLDGSRAVNPNDQYIDFRVDMAIDSLASGA